MTSSASLSRTYLISVDFLGSGLGFETTFPFDRSFNVLDPNFGFGGSSGGFGDDVAVRQVGAGDNDAAVRSDVIKSDVGMSMLTAVAASSSIVCAKASS